MNELGWPDEDDIEEDEDPWDIWLPGVLLAAFVFFMVLGLFYGGWLS